jgi:SGNH hydrolase-like domain, acetyltransferase AlgX
MLGSFAMLASRFPKGGLFLLVLLLGTFASPLQPLSRASESGVPGSATVIEGRDGWLFFEPELRFLSFPCFWGDAASKTARSPKPEAADPIPAIVNFHAQLAEQGILLLLVPVPPKAWNHPHGPEPPLEGVALNSLGEFYNQLTDKGIHVVDLRPSFAQQELAGESMFCKTDSHWSGAGCVTAALAVAKALSDFGFAASPADLREEWGEAHFQGDLQRLRGDDSAPEERLKIRRISKMDDTALQPDSLSPLLILGDSHTLVFHEFLSERAGFCDQVAKETGTIPDWIGTRGSGANAVRISLLRRIAKNPEYLASKKAVVWCFAAREFTEADQGWLPLPLRSTPRNP